MAETQDWPGKSTGMDTSAVVGAAIAPGTDRNLDLDRLRRKLDRICGGEAPRLETPRRAGTFLDSGEAEAPYRSLGCAAIDAALGGGLPASGLCEVHVDETRQVGALAGFGLGIAARLEASARRPVLWLGEPEAFREGGLPYGPGLDAFGLDPAALLILAARRLDDAAWAGEEAASCAGLCLVILEVRGNPRRLALEGTRRLHLRALAAGLPVLLLRQGGQPEATAAPMRLRIAPAAAAKVHALADQPLAERLIGHSVLNLSVEKSRHAPPRSLLLEWTPHERRFRTPSVETPIGATEPHPGRFAALSADRSHPARAAGAVLAFREAS